MNTTPPPPLPSQPIPPRRNWWSRNWKWFVPTGCLSLLALAVLFVVCICMIVFGAMKSSDAYKTALARAKSDPRVTSALGTPITEGWFVSGNTNVSGGSGNSDLSIPIHGPKGDAKIYAVAAKSEGEWQYSKLVVKVESTGETIDLSGQSKTED
jgi:hypothetical protein